MLRGFYLASNGLINQQRTLNTISNNVANSQTAGYKGDVSVQNTFDKELILLNGGRVNKTGTFEYKYNQLSKTNLEQGSFEFTQRPLDLAIKGPVYFNVETDGEDKVLTRNGQLFIDNEGYLAIPKAGRILGEDGPIKVGTSDFSVNTKGDVYVDGKLKDTLELTYIDDNENIQKLGDDTYTLVNEEQQLPEGTDYSIIQAAFERSNIDVAVEMTRAIEAQRTFESLSQAIKMLDAVNQKASTEIGKF